MPTRLARLCSGRVHYAWVVLAVMFTAMLAGVGVRAAPRRDDRAAAACLRLGRQHHLRRGLAQHHPARRDRPVPDRPDADHRPEAHDPAVPGAADDRHRAFHLHDRAVAAIPHLGADGRHRLRRRRGRHGRGGREPLVRPAHRLRHGAADRSQRRRATDLPASARAAGRALRLARRRHLRHAGDRRRAADRRDPAAGIACPDRPRPLWQHGDAGAGRRPRRRRQSVHAWRSTR